MKYLDEFRDPVLARRLVGEIRRTARRRWTIMEVCGGQTHSLLRYGIAAELKEVELIHGPGCPVCVTPSEAIDFAQGLALRPGFLLASFGDMLRVPGSRRSLLDVRAAGGAIEIVYSPLDAVALAERNSDRQVVFFAVGFETTAPATALAVLQAERLKIENFSLLVSHVRVEPAMEAIVTAPGNRVEGFLAAGHVATVTGYERYAEFARRHRLPIVVTGFEPIDLLEGIIDCVRQLEAGRCEVSNRYARSVRHEGNRSAQEVVDRVYEIADCPWRGLGVIPAGGLRLREAFRHYDAEHRFTSDLCTSQCTLPAPHGEECRSGEVLSGLIKPTDCSAFGKRCTPESPLGAPMVSSEGACAAYFRYRSAAHTETTPLNRDNA